VCRGVTDYFLRKFGQRTYAWNEPGMSVSLLEALGANGMDRMRILVLSGYLPWHGHGGGLLVGNLLRELNRRHDVTVLTFVWPDEEPYAAEVATVCRRLKTVPLSSLEAEVEQPRAMGLQVARTRAPGVIRKAWRSCRKPCAPEYGKFAPFRHAGVIGN